MMQEASKRYMKHFSICNIKGAEKFSWSFPVHLFPGVPALMDYGLKDVPDQKNFMKNNMPLINVSP